MWNGESYDLANHYGLPQGRAALVGTIKQLETCPYDNNHRVGAGRFAAHIEKCRSKLAPEIQDQFVICEFNATHHVHKKMYLAHLEVCNDVKFYSASRLNLDSYMGLKLPPIVTRTPEEEKIYQQVRAEEEYADLLVTRVGVPAAMEYQRNLAREKKKDGYDEDEIFKDWI